METVVRYAQLSKDFRKKHEHSFWINFTDCVRIVRYTNRQVKEVEELWVLVRQLTRVEDKDQVRFKKGVFNFIVGISKILFDTMDSNDALYYAEKVSNVEKEQLQFLSLSKEQVTVKSTLMSLKATLVAVSENKRILSRGLDEMAKHISEHDSEIKEIFSGTSMLLTVNKHNTHLERALGEYRCSR